MEYRHLKMLIFVSNNLPQIMRVFQFVTELNLGVLWGLQFPGHHFLDSPLGPVINTGSDTK